MSLAAHWTSLFLRLTEYHVNLKLFHFQARRFAAHKATDDLYSLLAGKIDDLLEVAQGKTRRLPAVQQTLRVKSFDRREFKFYTQKMIQWLEQTNRQLCTRPHYSDLCNILDEIRAALAKFIYLLTFQ